MLGPSGTSITSASGTLTYSVPIPTQISNLSKYAIMLSGFKKINNIDMKFRTTSAWNSSSPTNPIIISLTLTAPTEIGYLKYYVLFLGSASANYFWI